MVKRFLKERLGTILFLLIIAGLVIWGVFRIRQARENAITYNEDYTAPEGNADLLQTGSYKTVAKTDQLELLYNETKGAIQVRNLENGYLWKGIVDSEMYDLDNMNAQWAAYLQSSITISYNDLKKRDSGVKKIYAGKDCTWLETEYLDDGVSVTYGFLTPGIYVTVEYRLEGDQLVVRVPSDGIREDSKYAVTTIELLPFFGASGNEEGGYLFYPDGSGAITTYEKADTRPANVKQATYYTYTNKVVSFDNLEEDAYNRYTAAMPVYGIKSGDNALFAVATESVENTGICVYPSGIVVDLNHAGFELYTRNVFNVDMYSISTGTDSTVTGGTVQRVDKELIDEDKEVRYFFLSDEDADYSGMAQVYREYLIENGQLADEIDETDEMPLALELLMGTIKDGMLMDEFVSMTDFEQAGEILTSLEEQGVSGIEVVLGSWIDDYNDYENWGPSSGLGGKSGLKDLNALAESLQESTHIYLENQFTYASSKTDGLSENRDVVYNGLNTEVSVETMEGDTYYLLNPATARSWNQKYLSRLSKYGNYGVAYENLAKIVYPDYNETNPYTKTESVEELKGLLSDAEQEGRRIAVDGANAYCYSSTNYIYRLSESSFGLSITDYEVPFVQMVLSGRIPYSTDGAGNLAYDLQTQKLKWVECGALPYFYLTYESALELADTEDNTLFSSTFEDWESVAVEVWTEFHERLGDTYGHAMTEHEILGEDLYRVQYDNGVTVYINYAEEPQTADGLTIPAQDYVVTTAGGE